MLLAVASVVETTCRRGLQLLFDGILDVVRGNSTTKHRLSQRRDAGREKTPSSTSQCAGLAQHEQNVTRNGQTQCRQFLGQRRGDACR